MHADVYNSPIEALFMQGIKVSYLFLFLLLALSKMMPMKVPMITIPPTSRVAGIAIAYSFGKK